MNRAKSRIVTALLPLAATAACSTSAQYPSLAQRDVERRGGTAMPVAADTAPAAPALPPASADLVTRVNGLVAAARAADEQFRAQRPVAERAVGNAGGVGSDSWSGASVALGRLETSRSIAMGALAELDVLYADARDAAPTDESPSASAIAAARSQVSDIVAAQDSAIERLAGHLKG